MGFHAVAITREDLSIDVSLTSYCRTDIDEVRAISFLGVRIDTISEFSYGLWKHVGTQKISIQSSKLRVGDA